MWIREDPKGEELRPFGRLPWTPKSPKENSTKELY